MVYASCVLLIMLPCWHNQFIKMCLKQCLLVIPGTILHLEKMRGLQNLWCTIELLSGVFLVDDVKVLTRSTALSLNRRRGISRLLMNVLRSPVSSRIGERIHWSFPLHDLLPTLPGTSRHDARVSKATNPGNGLSCTFWWRISTCV